MPDYMLVIVALGWMLVLLLHGRHTVGSNPQPKYHRYPIGWNLPMTDEQRALAKAALAKPAREPTDEEIELLAHQLTEPND